MILLVDIEDRDQTLQMGRLIWAFAVRICQKTHFHMMQLVIMMSGVPIVSQLITLNIWKLNSLPFFY